jgi:hypothetical protein
MAVSLGFFFFKGEFFIFYFFFREVLDLSNFFSPKVDSQMMYQSWIRSTILKNYHFGTTFFFSPK